jgi:hypothetical protein
MPDERIKLLRTIERNSDDAGLFSYVDVLEHEEW